VKKRFGFISNSSSSSFVIKLHDLSGEQLHQVMSPDYTSQNCGTEEGFSCAWSIHIDTDKGVVEGYTGMDNFDMDKYFEEIGIPNSVVTWEY